MGAVLPPLKKSWQMSGAMGSTLCVPVLSTSGSWLPVFLSAIQAYPLFPYQVLGSSNAVAAGLDGVNRIVTAADVVGVAIGSAAPRSWVVIKNPATGVSWCIHARPLAAAGADSEWGFSNSSSFSGGSLTARPTAPDEHFIDLASLFNTGTAPGIMCAWHTADGKQTMAALVGRRLGADSLAFQFCMGDIEGVPGNIWPKPTWLGHSANQFLGVDPHYLCGNGAGFSVLAEKPPSFGSASFSLWFAAEAYGFPVTYGPYVDAAGYREIQPMNFYANSGGLRGYCGYWPDMLPFGRSEAESWTVGGCGNFPDASKNRVLIGAVAYPWDGASVWSHP
jgi:hypothetical protein